MYQPELGRWFCQDPLAEKYLSFTPYNFVANNPIFYFDPDGKEIKSHRETAEDGTITIVITVSGKLINNSSKSFTTNEMQTIADRIGSSIIENYTGSGETVKWRGVANISVASEDNSLSNTDHAFRLYDDGELPSFGDSGAKRRSGVVGYTPYRGNLIELSTMILQDIIMGDGRKATLERTLAHELGHSANLRHPTYDNPMPNNLMYQTPHLDSGNKLNENQILQIEEDFNEGNLNNGRQIIE